MDLEQEQLTSKDIMRWSKGDSGDALELESIDADTQRSRPPSLVHEEEDGCRAGGVCGRHGANAV